MCGIAGILNTKKDIRKTILSLNLSIKHRGPDDSGYYYDLSKRIGLTMSRLSIIGIEEGRQPKI